MSDSFPPLHGRGDPRDAPEYNVDPKALSPWPRLRGRPRRITYGQVFRRSWAILGVAYVLFALWLVSEPYRTVRESWEKDLVPILLVVMPVLAILAAALSALVLSAAWWFCWGSWNPHVSDLDATSETSGPDEQGRPAAGGDADAPIRPGGAPHQRRDALRARPKRSG
jgi:hypothetical protein